jgi:aspartyl-tRNA(Asn)/glutamyl-tRNA(Gln) amidotransferase subunit C
MLMSSAPQWDQAQAQKVARLARLPLSEEQAKRFSLDVQQMLRHVQLLSDLDIGDVPITTHAQHSVGVLRQDEVRPSLGADAALKNAPERLGDGFAVPKIIE